MIWQQLKKFLRKSRTQKVHTIYVLIGSAVFRFCIIVLPLRLIYRYLGRYAGKRELVTITSPEQQYKAFRTGRFIENIGKKTPWRSTCLVNTLIVRIYLKRYAIPHIVHVGLARKAGKAAMELEAHAWVTVGPVVVVGRLGHSKFTILSTYASEEFSPQVFGRYGVR